MDELDGLLSRLPTQSAPPPSEDDLDRLLAKVPTVKAASTQAPRPLPGTEAFGGKLPPMPAPPNAILQREQAPDFVKAAYEGKYGIPAPPTLGTAFEKPAANIAGGVERIAGAQNPREVAGGATQLLGGATELITPPEAMAPAIVAAPIGTALSVGAAALTQKGTEAGLKAAGVPEEYAGLAGTVAGLIAGGGGAAHLIRKAYVAAGSPEVKIGGKFPEPKPFSDMTDEELVNAANRVQRENPPNAQWQEREIVKEAQKRSAGRGMPEGEPPTPEAAAVVPEPVPETPGPAPINRGDNFDTPNGKLVVTGKSGDVILGRNETTGKSFAMNSGRFRALLPPPGAVPAPPEATSPGAKAPSSEPQAAAPKDDLDALIEKVPSRAGYVPVTPEPVNQPAKPVSEPHKFSSTQVNLPGPIAGHLANFGAAIPEDQLAEDGREHEPHITVKYGLHGDDSAEVEKLLKDEPPITATLGKASVFPAAETDTARGGAGSSDVLKVDVDSPDLHRLNEKIASLPHTDTYPTYQPHVTIAYLKPGEGEKYDGKEIPGVTGQKVELGSVTFSPKEGEKTEIALTRKPNAVLSEGVSAKRGSGEIVPPNNQPQEPEGGQPKDGDVKYVRFGAPPESGKSRNFRENTDESGVSTHKLVFHDGKWLLSDEGIGFTTLFDDRPQFEVTGKVVGKGADGEPLIKAEKSAPFAGDIRELGSVSRSFQVNTAPDRSPVPRIYRNQITGKLKLSGVPVFNESRGFDEWRSPEDLIREIRQFESQAHPKAVEHLIGRIREITSSEKNTPNEQNSPERSAPVVSNDTEPPATTKNPALNLTQQYDLDRSIKQIAEIKALIAKSGSKPHLETNLAQLEAKRDRLQGKRVEPPKPVTPQVEAARIGQTIKGRTEKEGHFVNVRASVAGDTITVTVKNRKPDSEEPEIFAGKPSVTVTIPLADWKTTEKHPNPNYPQAQLLRKALGVEAQHENPASAMRAERVADAAARSIRDALAGNAKAIESEPGTKYVLPTFATSPGQRAPKAQKPSPALERARKVYAPGNVVTGYWGTHNRVLEFEEGVNTLGMKDTNAFKVKVQELDKEGNPKGEPRWHSTPPGPDTKVISRAPEESKIEPETREPEQPTAAEPAVSEPEPGPSGSAGRTNPEPLEGKPAEDVSRTPVEGSPEAGSVERRGVDEGVSAPGVPEGAALPERAGESETDRVPPVRRGRSAPPEQSVVSHDYRITPADALGQGGPVSKARGNIDAIRILREVTQAGREATPEEQAKLVKYVGWGQVPQIFDYYRREFAGLREDLEGLLTPEEFAAARKSTTNAHYTTPEVITGMWDAMRRLGIEKNPRTLDPGSGISHFRGLVPDDMLPVRYTAVELDPTSAAIAALLYPSGNIQNKGFEKTSLPGNYFDIAIGNIPFGNFGVSDPAYRKTPIATRSIHNYFFVKSLDKVRPGGIVAFVTSSFTMDEVSPAMRNLLAAKADLLGAIRLPGGRGGAFAKNAGTEVTTDIIFLQKRAPQTPASGEKWVSLAPVKGTGGDGKDTDIPINEYYARHPEMMLGKMELEGTMYGPDKSKVLTGTLTPENLAAAIAKLPEGAYKPVEAEEQKAFQPNPIHELPNAGEIKDGGFGLKDGKIIVREGDTYRPADLTSEQSQRVKGMLGVRDAVREVFRTQLSDAAESEIVAARKKLNEAYDKYVKSPVRDAKGKPTPAGPLNAPANFKAMMGDPDAPLLASLERYDPDTGVATKAAIFAKRTIEKYKPVEHVEGAPEALAVALAEKGRISWDRMQELTGKTPKELREQLGPLVYQNPEGHAWETSDEYLSGDVRAKLREAEVSAKTDKAFERNVEALRAVQPKDLTPGQINARLGAPWLPKDDVRDFIGHLLDVAPYQINDIRVSHAGVVGHWGVYLPDNMKGLAANTNKWGDDNFTAAKLIEMALNLQTPTVRTDVWVGPGAKDYKNVVDKKGTLAAQEKQDKIRKEFQNWLWSEPQRATRLARQYNDEYNNLVLRRYNGSHLTFPGMARLGLRNNDLDAHQKDAVWRTIVNGNTLLAHVVGAGKTFEMIAAGMEMKSLGLIKKPMYVVPNHLVSQWASDFARLYPAANVFAAGKEHFSTGNRQKAMSRIATGDYDAVIVAHRSFQFLPVSDATFESFVHEQIKDIDTALEEAEREDGAGVGRGSRGRKGQKNRSIKELEKAKARLEKKREDRSKRDKSDKTIDFEQMGVDQVFVDEADLFKNLYYVTKMTRIAGLPNSESDRAMDMFIKSQYLTRLNGGQRGVVFATGTPISNSLAEMYTMQRYLAMEHLKHTGVQNFDSWAQAFAAPETGLELAPEGRGYRQNTRMKFINVPELITAFRTFSDVKNADDLNLPRPAIAGGKPTIISVPASPELKGYVTSLGKRAEAIRGGKVRPDQDNMLAVVTAGRKAALDMRLVAPGLKDNPGSKLNIAVSKIAQIWKENKAKKSTQLVFLDLGTPRASETGKEKDGEPVATNQPEDSAQVSVYQDLRNKLIAKGVSPAEIKFIHDAKDDAAKQLLFGNVRSGKVRVLIGSTEKMGAGTNVQDKLIALHHLDVPWRPRDVEQRDGRALRQGNENPEVNLFRYVTEDSFDAYSWQTILNKAKTIAQAMSGDLSVRELEDSGVMIPSAAEAMALSSGSPEVRERIGVDMEVRKLETLKEAHQDQQRTARMEVERLPKSIGALNQAKQEEEKFIAERNAFRADQEPWTVKGVKDTFKEAGKRNEALARAAFSLLGSEGNKEIGSYKGFPVVAVGRGSHKYFENGKAKEEPNAPTVEVDGRSTGVYVGSGNEGLTVANAIRYVVDQQSDASLRQVTDDIAKSEKRLTDLTAELGKPFDQQARLDQLQARLKELNDKLDIGKADEQAALAGDGQGDVAAEEKKAELNPSIAQRMPGKRTAFRRGQDTAFHAREARIEPIELDPSDARAAEGYVANPSALEFLDRVLDPRGTQDVAGDNWGAAHLGPGSMLRAQVLLSQALLRNVDAEGVGQVLLAVHRALESGKSLILVKDAPGISDFRRQSALNEEISHALQAEASPTKTLESHLAQSRQAILGSPLGKKAVRAIDALGYKNYPEGQKMAEIGARLMEPGRFRELGLKYREARKLGAQYIQALRKEYGSEPARELSERTATALRRTDRHGAGKHVPLPGRSGQGGGSGPGAGAGPGLSANIGRRAEGGLEPRNPQEGIGGNPRELRPEGAGGRQPDQNALYPHEGPAGRSVASRLLSEESGQLNITQLGHAAYNAGIKMRAATDDLMRLLAPAAREGAKPAALAVRNRAAEFARSQARAEAALEGARKVLAALAVEQRWDFYDRAERGLPQRNASLAPIAQEFRKLLDAGRKDVQDLGTGKLENFIENYLPHIYNDPAKAKSIFASYYSKRPMEGKKSFLKRRSFETLKDAMDAGLEPVSQNPVDMVVLKLAEMNRYVMAHRVLNDLKDQGVVHYVRAGQTPPPGYQKIDDQVATVFGPAKGAVGLPSTAEGVEPEDVRVFGRRIMGQYYAPEPAARIINNFLSPGLRETSPLFRGYLAGANAMNQFQLGFSAFHLGFTSVDAAVSKAALGIYQAAHGHPLQALKSANPASIVAAPVTGIIRGDKILKEYYKPGSQASQIADIVDAMVMAGGRARMDSFYQSQMTQKMMDAFRAAVEPGRNVFSRGQKLGAGAIRAPFALAEQTVKPILEWIVPRQKLAVFADLAQFEMQRLTEGKITPEELPAALARAWDSVDNRMGQLVYDNLFWHKATKDILMGTTRSVGWNTGTIREILGGTVDIRHLLPKPADPLDMKDTPSGWTWKPDMSTRLSYLIALPALLGLAGAVTYYLWHGHMPEHLIDCYLIPDKKGNRWWLPSYMKDVLGVAAEGPMKVIKGKLHPFLTGILEMLSNKDYFDRPIRNLDDPIMKQLQEEANFALQQMAPMSMKAPAGKHPQPQSLEERMRQQIGITRVPAGVAHPERVHGSFHPANEKSPYDYPITQNIPHFAHGGVVTHPIPEALVAEEGPEKVVDLGKGGDIVRGSTDIPLSDKGEQQAQHLGERFEAKGGVDEIVSSDMTRAVQTAEAIHQATGAPIAKKTKSLRPWQMGSLEGKPRKEVQAQIDRYALKAPNAPMPGKSPDSTSPGESFNTRKRLVIAETQVALAKLRKNPDLKIVLLLHGSAARMNRAWVAKGAAPSMEVDRAMANRVTAGEKPAQVERLYFDEDKHVRIERVNMESDSHLKGGVYQVRHADTAWNSGGKAEGREEKVVSKPTIMPLGQNGPQEVIPLAA
jgi:N12 class adenine-specific DNA methylase/broad specificity phosphatase PhoE